jgi:hypothetical protein
VISKLAFPAATVVVPGLPPNWSQFRGSSLRRDVAKAEWRDLTWRIAHSERNRVRWPLPLSSDPLRYLSVQIRKHKPLYDHDGAVSALKPVIDGLKGVLAYDDSPRYLALITPPDQIQTLVTTSPSVVLTVHLADPRETS